MTRVLITGVNGLLGANTAEVLLERGYAVRGLVRPTANLKGIQGLDVELVKGQLLDPEDLHRAMEDVDYVVHSAAYTRQWSRSYSNYDINITGTERIIAACLQHSVKRLVHVGTANAFGFGKADKLADETGVYQSRQDGSPYLQSKQAAQQLILKAVKDQDLPACIVNPTNMIGARDAGPSSGVLLLIALKNRLLGKRYSVQPPTTLNFIHVRDAAVGTVLALEKGRIGECYLLANENLSYQQIFDMLEEVVEETIYRLKIPSALLTVAGELGSTLEGILNRPLAMNHINAAALTEGRYYNPQKAVSELGLPQTPISDALRDAVNWFQENGYL